MHRLRTARRPADTPTDPLRDESAVHAAYRAAGTVATYEVTHTDQFPKAEFPTFAVFGATNDEVLRLVTCTGEFDRSVRSYFDNLVVHARRVD